MAQTLTSISHVHMATAFHFFSSTLRACEGMFLIFFFFLVSEGDILEGAAAVAASAAAVSAPGAFLLASIVGRGERWGDCLMEIHRKTFMQIQNPTLSYIVHLRQSFIFSTINLA